MEIQMAPLQGFTEAHVRNLFAECFGGISEYYTPFMRLEKQSFRNKDLKDIDPERNTVEQLVPQIIAAGRDEATRLVEKVSEYGYRDVDINMGCPFPLMVRKGRGAGILSHPDKVGEVLGVVQEFPEIRFSVKLRLGWESAEEIFALLDLLNALPLRQVTLHPRLGVQQYKGSCSMEAFSRFYALCEKPLVYNGDVLSVADLERLSREYPRLKGVMIGRGLLAAPWMASEFQEQTPWTAERRRKAFRSFHEQLLAAYSSQIEGGQQQLLGKMQSFWEYLLSGEDRKLLKKIRKASDLNGYCRAVDALTVTLG